MQQRIDTGFLRRFRVWLRLLAGLWIMAGCIVLTLLAIRPASAAETGASAAEPDQALPAGARRWRGDLVRAAHSVWGLDAPVPVFAAQVHQESSWRSDLVSRVGATGMAQFMPATASWWCRIHKMSAEECRPRNPVWALRALVGYDKWIWDQIGRIPGAGDMDPYSRMWATLRSYNGGLGHWQAEARKSGSFDRLAVDTACGRAKRHRSHCKENLGYPKNIMVELQTRYSAWGPMLELAAYGGAR